MRGWGGRAFGPCVLGGDKFKSNKGFQEQEEGGEERKSYVLGEQTPSVICRMLKFMELLLSTVSAPVFFAAASSAGCVHVCGHALRQVVEQLVVRRGKRKGRL